MAGMIAIDGLFGQQDIGDLFKMLESIGHMRVAGRQEVARQFVPVEQRIAPGGVRSS